MELAEILAALNALPDADAAVAALQSDTGAVVKAFRSKLFAQGKTEGKKEVKALEEERDRLKGEIQTATEELEQLKAKAPDKDAIEAPLKAKIAKLEAAASESTAAAQSRIRKLLAERDLGGFKALLAGTHAEAAKLGIARQLDPDYVAVLAQQYADRFRYNDKDELEVLDEDGVPFVVDARTPAFAALAAQLNKAAPDKWAMTRAEGGAGVGGQGGGTGYDPVAAGKKMAEDRKAAAPDTSLAFK